ncbi:MAG TPA: DUF2157 domain-containing protein [Gammaproteobacteria bacterium]|nr:DUF2157 domain-containing protein [Gammaproteobacteria bacterium]
MHGSPDNKTAAQQRVDRIAAFHAELDALEQAGLLTIDPLQKAAITAYHQVLQQQLQQRFDVDLNQGSKQLSRGMQIVSFLGALALAASVFFLFYQYWGYMSTVLQCALLLAAPLLTLGAAIYIRRREQTGYFAKLAALISFACFVLNLSMLGQIFNITPSPNAFLVWGVYAALLAYALDVRLLLACALFCVAGFLAAEIGSWSGMYWLGFGERPENFLLPTLIAFCVPWFFNHDRHCGFVSIYRVLSMIGFFVAVLILSNWGAISYLRWPASIIEGLYQTVGFATSAAAIWLGMRMRWPQVMVTGNVFFALFLYTKFFDWWWGWMPKYIFFFLIGLTAILALLVFKRLREAQLKAVQS